MSDQPTAPPAPTATTDPTCSWQSVRDSCHAAVELSRQVHHRLMQGGDPTSMLPLLKREAALVKTIQHRIAMLGGAGGAGTQHVDRSGHSQLIAEMAKLLRLEGENHQLLSSRGVQLSGPRARLRGRQRRLIPGDR